MGECRLCGEDKPLGRSHVIPASFFRAAQGESDDHLLLVTDKKETPYEKRLRNGVYDASILCHECERLFSSLDDYASKVLLQSDLATFKKIGQPSTGRVVAYQSDDIDQERLLRFFIATLWRASVSGHEFYDRVNLGRWESAAARVILRPGLSIPAAFGAILSLWEIPTSEAQSAVKPLMDPYAGRLVGVRCYRFLFGRFVADVKVDQRPFSADLARMSLCTSPTLTIVARDLTNSKDMAVLRGVARRAHENRQQATAAKSRR